MGIVGEQHVLVIAYAEVKATIHATVCLHAITKLISRTTIKLCHCHCCYAVLDVDRHRLTKFNTLDILYWRNKVEGNLTILNADVLCVEITFVLRVGICPYTIMNIRLNLKTCMDDESTARLN